MEDQQQRATNTKPIHSIAHAQMDQFLDSALKNQNATWHIQPNGTLVLHSAAKDNDEKVQNVNIVLKRADAVDKTAVFVVVTAIPMGEPYQQPAPFRLSSKHFPPLVVSGYSLNNIYNCLIR